MTLTATPTPNPQRSTAPRNALPASECTWPLKSSFASRKNSTPGTASAVRKATSPPDSARQFSFPQLERALTCTGCVETFERDQRDDEDRRNAPGDLCRRAQPAE